MWISKQITQWIRQKLTHVHSKPLWVRFVFPSPKWTPAFLLGFNDHHQRFRIKMDRSNQVVTCLGSYRWTTFTSWYHRCPLIIVFQEVSTIKVKDFPSGGAIFGSSLKDQSVLPGHKSYCHPSWTWYARTSWGP